MMQGVHLRSGVWVLSVLYAVCRGHIVQCACEQLYVFCEQCAVASITYSLRLEIIYISKCNKKQYVRKPTPPLMVIYPLYGS